MKKNIVILLGLIAGFFTSCSHSDNDINIDENAKGNLQLYFDPTANGDQLLLGTSYYPSEEQEQLSISKFNFIISNIRLIDAQGKEYVYPKNESYFIINTEKENFTVNLKNIPEGDYTKIILGLGVDKEKYLTGEENQQDFWDLAATQDMTWSWITGYKFVSIEGEFKSATITSPTRYEMHIGSHGTALDDYKEITLSLPSKAKVRKSISPSVHLLVDALKLVNGSNKIKLENHLNPAGTSAVIMVNAEWSPKVMENATEMFTVDHVHNNGENH